MPDTTQNLALPLIAGNQAQKHVTHNEALVRLDALVQLACLDKDRTAPPGDPAEGDRYLVAAAAPTGAWAGLSGQIACFRDGVWVGLAPRPGWLVYVADEADLYTFTGDAWTSFRATLTVLQNLARLGVGTAADAVNRLAVKSEAALFTWDDATPGQGNMRQTVNKKAAANDAGFVFQTGFATRALFGTFGSDDVTLKVSADGAAFSKAIAVAAATGNVAIGGPADGNRLSVVGSAARFSGDGAGFRTSFSKQNPSGELGLYFQVGTSARARIGTLGPGADDRWGAEDYFGLHLSIDGAAWNRVLTARSSGVVFTTTDGGADGQSQLKLRALGTAPNQRAALAFYPSFGNYPADPGPRRAADILVGFAFDGRYGANAQGTWGGEYIAFNVGRAGTPNDSEGLGNEQMRLTTGGFVLPGAHIAKQLGAADRAWATVWTARACLVGQAADPASPSFGQIYANSTITALKWHDGTAWRRVNNFAKAAAATNFDNYVAAGIWTKVQFNAADANEQGAFVSAGNRFVAPEDGLYGFSAALTYKRNGSSAPSAFEMQFYRNGAAAGRGRAGATGTLVDGVTALGLSCALRLAAGDAVEVWARFTGADGYVAAADSFFGGRQLP